ncbi:MAG: 4'-phosphopantetheinyl transferase family protein [Waterburya sp.]
MGVDLEYLREMENIIKLAKRFFTHREFQLIADLTGREQQIAFYQLWTAKEAYLKAIGTGLSSSLTEVELSLDGANPKFQGDFWE